MAAKSGFGRGVAWMAIGNWTEQAINLVIFILMARLLGAEAFGLLAMAAAFVILCEFLVRESLSDYLIAAESLAAVRELAVFIHESEGVDEHFRMDAQVFQVRFGQ